MKRIFNIPNLLFVLLMVIVFMPGKRTIENPIPFIAVIVFAEVVFQIKLGKPQSAKAAKDITCILFIFFILWELVSTKLDIVKPILGPSPENVFYVFVSQRELIWSGFVRSMFLLFSGTILALVLGVLLGLFVGWIPRLRKAIFPVAKVLSTVPALVYAPYVIVVAPGFTSGSIFVIFCGVFWPTFMNMINRVGTIDHRIIDSAKTLNVSTTTMLFKVVFPYALPRIINELTVSITIAFMTLTVAEMLGANVGMGYFVRKFCDYVDFEKVFAGIIFIGVVVSVLHYVVGLLKKRLVKWSY